MPTPRFLLYLAANFGNSNSQYNLGLLYCNGLGVVQDHEKAAMWIQRAAEQGHAAAQDHLGQMYRWESA